VSHPPVLRLSGITKRFGALVANDDISLDLAGGEVLALLGENGAGKSTLVSILFGHYVADAGSIEVFGRALPPGDPASALAAGIGMVHQHFTLADNLSVLDNVLIGTERLWQPFSRRHEARARLADISKQFGLAVRWRAPTRRNPQSALSGRANPDPGRAHGGSHAARVGRAVRDAQNTGRGRLVDHFHLAQAG
jgi:ABC-type uncharacterized transport system ATPase subunit